MTQAPDESELLALALRAARAAAELLVARRPEHLAVAATKSSPTDIVTAMDTASERLIVETLRERRPRDAVMGEEGAHATGSSGVRWIIDPIDGTVNYLYGLPGWCVSIAAEVAGEIVVGVVAVPSYGETFSAVRGQGAYRDGEPIRCAAPVPLAQALVATGFGYSAARRSRQAQLLTEVLPRVRDVRRVGAAAGDLCSVACGRVNAYYEAGLADWDRAAGGLIAREAGALVGGLREAPASERLTLAAPAGMFEPLHDLLAALDADAEVEAGDAEEVQPPR